MAKVSLTGVITGEREYRGWWGPYWHYTVESDVDENLGFWFTGGGNGSRGVRYGNRGTLTGYTRVDSDGPRLYSPVFEQDTTPLPEHFLGSDGVDLIQNAHDRQEDPMARLIIADWLESKMDEVSYALAGVIRSSLYQDDCQLLPWKICGKAAPFTGAWCGWLIGRDAAEVDETGGKLWLDYRFVADTISRAEKEKKKKKKGMPSPEVKGLQ